MWAFKFKVIPQTRVEHIENNGKGLPLYLFGSYVSIKVSIHAKLNDFLLIIKILIYFLMTYARVGYEMSFMTHTLP